MSNELSYQPNNIPILQSPFEQLCEHDAEVKEWWNSRKLARIMGQVQSRLACYGLQEGRKRGNNIISQRQNFFYSFWSIQNNVVTLHFQNKLNLN